MPQYHSRARQESVKQFFWAQPFCKKSANSNTLNWYHKKRTIMMTPASVLRDSGWRNHRLEFRMMILQKRYRSKGIYPGPLDQDCQKSAYSCKQKRGQRRIKRWNWNKVLTSLCIHLGFPIWHSSLSCPTGFFSKSNVSRAGSEAAHPLSVT